MLDYESLTDSQHYETLLNYFKNIKDHKTGATYQ